MSNEVDQKHLHLLSTTDASKWAKEFCAVEKALTGVELDEGWVNGWFANAIETCRRITERKYEGDPTKHPIIAIGAKPISEKTKWDKALITAVLLLSVRGDVSLEGPEDDVPCSALTMEGIFDRLVWIYDEKLMAHTK
jgi:hypothetical protein